MSSQFLSWVYQHVISSQSCFFFPTFRTKYYVIFNVAFLFPFHLVDYVMCLFYAVNQDSQQFLSCAENRHRGDCESTRGLGATTGRCQWRQGTEKGRLNLHSHVLLFFLVLSTKQHCSWGSKHGSYPTLSYFNIKNIIIIIIPGIAENYSTCSPDLRTCPDSFCDAIESKDTSTCPQDCTSKFWYHSFWVKESWQILTVAFTMVTLCACACAWMWRANRHRRSRTRPEERHPGWLRDLLLLDGEMLLWKGRYWGWVVR